MTALSQKDPLAYGAHEIHHVYPPVGAAGALYIVRALSPPDEDRSVEFFRELVRDNSDNADAPRGIADNDHFPQLSLLQVLARLFKHPRDLKFAARIKSTEKLCAFTGKGNIVRRKKFKGA